MTQGLDLLRAAAHEGDAIDLGQIGGGKGDLVTIDNEAIVWLEVAPQASQW